MMSQRSRVRVLLRIALTEGSRKRYVQALEELVAWCHEDEVDFEALNEERQDWYLADRLLKTFESLGRRAQCAELFCALAKADPWAKYRVAWKMLDIWATRQPPRQAPAIPPGIVTTICTYLTFRDMVMASCALVGCLGRTNRNREQKVMCANVVAPKSVEERVFQVLYGSLLYWLKKIGAAKRLDDVCLTTLSVRRSGATELSRRGAPWAEIVECCRWNAERAAKEYIRRGEVAVYQSGNYLCSQVWQRATKMAANAACAHTLSGMTLCAFDGVDDDEGAKAKTTTTTRPRPKSRIPRKEKGQRR